jgi:putative ABC transport system ATP-binding protein
LVLIVVVAVGTVLLSMKSQLASLIEQQHDLGIFKAIGWANSDIVWQLITESVLQAAAGSFLGILAGAVVTVLLPNVRGYDPGLFSNMTISPVVLAMAFFLGITGGIAAAGYPAWVAARQHPSQLLRCVNREITIASSEQSISYTNGTVLECRDLRKRFISRTRTVNVLNGVNLTVHAGEIIVISGKSGAGKSTCLHILAGLDRPTEGTITFDKKSLNSLSNSMLARIRREQMGIIFQHSNLLPSWTAIENIEAALYHKCISRKTRRELAMTLLCSLGLGDRWKHLPSELSAGEQQRVAIARALINDPQIIFADEPTGDVDPQTAAEVSDILVHCVRKRGASLVLVTHGTFPQGFADRRLTLTNGVIS